MDDAANIYLTVDEAAKLSRTELVAFIRGLATRSDRIPDDVILERVVPEALRAVATGQARPSDLDVDDMEMSDEELARPIRRRGERGPQKAPTKMLTTIRLDADVVAALKEGGRGWQSRANALLRKALKL